VKIEEREAKESKERDGRNGRKHPPRLIFRFIQADCKIPYVVKYVVPEIVISCLCYLSTSINATSSLLSNDKVNEN